MITFAAAIEAIHANSHNFGSEDVALLDANRRILAVDLCADRDFPPFNRITMDGIAISSKAFREGRRSFMIAGIQAAGRAQQKLMDEQTCIEIMTGAVLPEGCDAIIPYEDCLIAGGIAEVHVAEVAPGQNIHLKGSDERAGQKLVKKGLKINPAIIGIAATIGLEMITVERLPRIAVCSTGDELVAVSEVPGAHQIRRSNSYMLAAALSDEGIVAGLYHLPDDPVKMNASLTSIIGQYDALLFSGAVSKGRFDFLPSVLDELGMETIFHRIAQKPGKPMLFGRFREGTAVFGFPGNPVSTLVCYHLFFKAWLHTALRLEPIPLTAFLTQDVSFKPALEYHLPVKVAVADGALYATPNAGSNSGDMVSLANAHAVITLPAARHDFKKGELFNLTWLQQPEAG